MPQATDLTVKNGASTPVDKTFNLIAPASGDGGIAQWALKEGPISAVFPTLTASARPTSNASRQLRIKFRTPSSFTEAATGRTLVASGAEMNVTFSIPGDYPESLKADFVAFSTNLLNHSLIKAMIRDAYPAT